MKKSVWLIALTLCASLLFCGCDQSAAGGETTTDTQTETATETQAVTETESATEKESDTETAPETQTETESESLTETESATEPQEEEDLSDPVIQTIRLSLKAKDLVFFEYWMGWEQLYNEYLAYADGTAEDTKGVLATYDSPEAYVEALLPVYVNGGVYRGYANGYAAEHLLYVEMSRDNADFSYNNEKVQADIDSYLGEMEEMAVAEGVSLEAYLEQMIGVGVRERHVRTALEIYLVSTAYVEWLTASLQDTMTEAEITVYLDGLLVKALDRYALEMNVEIMEDVEQEINAHETSDFEETDLVTNYVKMTVKGHGDVILCLRGDIAPITVRNFKNLVSQGFYDGLTFHRVVQKFMIQGGDPAVKGGNGTAYIKGEFSANGVQNDLSHLKGVISMARLEHDMDSGSCQFFICTNSKKAATLDGKYASFGYVVAGLDVVDSIAAVEVEYSVYGELSIPVEDVVIEKICFVTKK